MNDLQVILKALTKEREDLHQQLMQVDRIIKRMREGNYSEDNQQPKQIVIEPKRLPVSPLSFGNNNRDKIKVLVLRSFDIVRKVARLKDIQEEYNKISGNTYDVRETVRSLHRSGLLRMVRERNVNRGMFWIKTEWVENDKLIEDYKPEGFDVLYDADNIVFE